MTISFYVLGQEKAVGVLFMSPLKLTRGAKLEGYNVDGIAVQEDYRGQGIGTFLMQVAKEEATLAAAEEGGDGNKTALSITVQEQLQRWLYPQGFTKNVEGRSVSWGANSQSFYWRLDDLCLDAIREWKWKARGMINPDCLCQLVSVAQVLLGNSIFTTHLRKATWPIWRAGQCGDQNFQGNCAISPPRAAAEARRAEAVVAKRLAQRFVLGVWSGRMY
jgi:hypothetical protein